MKIGIDIMGGDDAPENTIQGAILAHQYLEDDVKLVLIGDQKEIESGCQKASFDPDKFTIVHTDQVIEMGENPVRGFSTKRNSSIAVGFGLLHNREIDGFTSAGNTGAMLVGAIQSIKSIPGIIRPGIAASIPMPYGNHKIIIDVGLNADCKPDVLYQYAILGSIYAKHVFGIDNPRVSLLNIGSEEEKGNLLTKSTYMMMKDSIDFNFIGNTEANELFDNSSDVVVCDGFVGNALLKQAEAFYTLFKQKGLKDPYIDTLNFENYGGTPILGVNKIAVIGHGRSNIETIKNMILHTKNIIGADLPHRIKQALN